MKLYLRVLIALYSHNARSYLNATKHKRPEPTHNCHAVYVRLPHVVRTNAAGV